MKAKIIFGLAILVLAISVVHATCPCTCPSNQDSVGKIFSSKPSTFIKELLISGRGNGCCECAVDCKNTAGCEQTLCSSGVNTFPGFNLPEVTCQMFTSNEFVPDKSFASGFPHWGHQCSPCT
jgi:hypothetical protein